MYYPKSQIKVGLYTNGNEYVYEDTLQDYTGPYWTTSLLDTFSGTSPTDPTSVKLIRKQQVAQPSTLQQAASQPEGLSEDLPINFTINRVYASLKNLSLDPTKQPKAPTSSNPIPTSDNYKVGQFYRYFCKKNNEVIYLEIDSNTYNKLSKANSELLWQLYTPFFITWILTGDMQTVYTANKQSVEFVMKKYNLTNLAQFLKNDYLKYYRG